MCIRKLGLEDLKSQTLKNCQILEQWVQIINQKFSLGISFAFDPNM